jgi:hypothetical protein
MRLETWSPALSRSLISMLYVPAGVVSSVVTARWDSQEPFPLLGLRLAVMPPPGLPADRKDVRSVWTETVLPADPPACTVAVDGLRPVILASAEETTNAERTRVAATTTTSDDFRDTTFIVAEIVRT